MIQNEINPWLDPIFDIWPRACTWMLWCEYKDKYLVGERQLFNFDKYSITLFCYVTAGTKNGNIYNLYKYNFKFGQIHLSIWKNTVQQYVIFDCTAIGRALWCEYRGNGFKFENGDDSGIWVNAIQVSFCLVPENVFRNKIRPSLLKCHYYAVSPN